MSFYSPAQRSPAVCEALSGDEFALRHTLRSGASEVFRMRDGDVEFRDVSDEQPDGAARLRGELLAFSETADRLGQARRVFPPPDTKALAQGRR